MNENGNILNPICIEYAAYSTANTMSTTFTLPTYLIVMIVVGILKHHLSFFFFISNFKC